MISEEERSGVWARIGSQDLVAAIGSLKGEAEIRAFLRDIATETELATYVMRLEVAKRLLAGNSFAQIAEETGQSPTTITRVNRWLKGGAGGYKIVIPRLRRVQAASPSKLEGGAGGGAPAAQNLTARKGT
jgi:TrpR-related protein YerC/YecD